MKPELISGIIIGLISFSTLCIVLLGIKKTADKIDTKVNLKKILIIAAGWLIIIGILSSMGIFASSGLPPRPMVAMLIALIILVSFAFSASGKNILASTPLHWLLFLQAFRILVELWFYFSYKQGVFPRIMSFEGANHDIYAGLLAIVAGFIVMKMPAYARGVGLVYNVVGFLLLANTLKAAVTSFPSPIQQNPWDERFLQLGQFPFIYLPAILVPIALGFHIISIKQIFSRKKETSIAAVA